MTTDRPRARSSRSSATMRSPASGSSAAVGSSSSSTSGSLASARARATRCFSPPDSVRASRCRIGSSSPTARMSSLARTSPSDLPWTCGPASRFRRTLPSNIAGCCARKATRVRNCVGAIRCASRPPSNTAPASGSRRVARARANVLLPLPQAPGMATASPGGTRTDAPSRILRSSRTTTSSRASSVEVISRLLQSLVAWPWWNLTVRAIAPPGDPTGAVIVTTSDEGVCRIRNPRAQTILHPGRSPRNYAISWRSAMPDEGTSLHLVQPAEEAAEPAVAEATPWGDSFLARPAAGDHIVQFYEDERFLFDAVAHFTGAGLAAGEPVLIVATKPHRMAFAQVLRHNGCRIEEAVASGLLTMLDAHEMLLRFMVGNEPEAERFYSVIGAVIQSSRQGRSRARVRVFGEMVDLLWRGGNRAAAIRLEELWSELARLHSFTLLCAYSMGNFYMPGDGELFDKVCSRHSHVIPGNERIALRSPEHEVQQRKDGSRFWANVIISRILGRDGNLVGFAKVTRDLTHRRALDEERIERAALEQSLAEQKKIDELREQLIGIVGHDLRSPLSSVVVRAELMLKRGMLHDADAKVTARIARSAERMAKIISQLLDFTRSRLGGGMRIEPREVDLAEICAQVIAEVETVHPDRAVSFEADSDVRGVWDRERLAQVVSNLVGNAIAYGKADGAVSVVLRDEGDSVTLSVHNEGPAIPAEVLPAIFDPFRRQARRTSRNSDGLGLGLFICRELVAAHGGEISVQSTDGAGTTFTVRLPRTP